MRGRGAGKPLIRLQCYEGLDESKAIYEWDYRRQLLQLQLHRGEGTSSLADAGIFGEEFLLSRPLLAAIRAAEPVVLLIDEVDRLDIESEALLLEVLSEYQVSIPELGTVTARHIPQVFLTSNNTRDLSEALKRRCLYLHLGYPSTEREAEIIRLRVPGLPAHLASEIAEYRRAAAHRGPAKAAVHRRVAGLGPHPADPGRDRADRRHHPADAVGAAQVRAGHRHRAGRTVPGLTVRAMLGALVAELRAVGIPVSVGEHLDAAGALAAIPLADKEVLADRAPGRPDQEPGAPETFNLIFELPHRGHPGVGPRAAGRAVRRRAAGRAAPGHRRQCRPALAQLADEYVRRFGGRRAGRARWPG